jgi:nitroimidazol reductase NimA-like FMN-containing flavoprotein (pyridoxamine 5'-phosphate oxidase superfamily)
MADAELEALSLDECLALLRGHVIGRVAVVDNNFPVILPVNYRLVETSGKSWIALRTRRGNVIDQAAMPVAFEIDRFEVAAQEGWSVLVRGTLHHVNPVAGGFAERFDPQPWLEDERDAWLIIEAFSISGRRLRSPQPHWAFHIEGYV